jgi:hypothetical protein
MTRLVVSGLIHDLRFRHQFYIYRLLFSRCEVHGYEGRIGRICAEPSLPSRSAHKDQVISRSRPMDAKLSRVAPCAATGPSALFNINYVDFTLGLSSETVPNRTTYLPPLAGTEYPEHAPSPRRNLRTAVRAAPCEKTDRCAHSFGAAPGER